MLGAVLLMSALQLAVVYIPFLQTVFGTTALAAGELLTAILAGATVLLAVELWKWSLRSRGAAW
jgi:Ca2+-transporting ATPase